MTQPYDGAAAQLSLDDAAAPAIAATPTAAPATAPVPQEAAGTAALAPFADPLAGLPPGDVQPIRYRIRVRAFESQDEAVPEIVGHVLGIQKSRWLPAKPADPQQPQDVPLTQCEMVQAIGENDGIGAWRLDPADPFSATEERRCGQCPMNQWGTAGPGRRGKACREKRLLLVLRDGDALPVIVSAPPTSVHVVRRWVSAVATRGLHPALIHVRLRVRPERRGQEEWGVLAIEELGLLDSAGQAALRERLVAQPLIHRLMAAWAREDGAQPDRAL